MLLSAIQSGTQLLASGFNFSHISDLTENSDFLVQPFIKLLVLI